MMNIGLSSSLSLELKFLDQTLQCTPLEEQLITLVSLFSTNTIFTLPVSDPIHLRCVTELQNSTFYDSHGTDPCCLPPGEGLAMLFSLASPSQAKFTGPHSGLLSIAKEFGVLSPRPASLCLPPCHYYWEH